MDTLWTKLNAYARCVGRISRLSRLAGGAEALERRLAELEKDILSGQIGNTRCAHCGSNELEPVEAASTPSGTEVAKFRCKACGLVSG